MSLTSTNSSLGLNDREEIQYLLGNAPSWMMHYGISMVAGFFGLLLALSYFIHYPDVLEAEVTLTTARPPVRIMAEETGSISEILISDHQEVEEEQVLAIIENPANWKDVLFLEKWLERYSNGNESPLPGHLDLGSLQTSYSNFSQNLKDFLYFSNNHNTEIRIEGLIKQIEQLQEMNQNLSRQKDIAQQEYILANKQMNRQTQLHSNQLISDLEYERAETEWLFHKRNLEQMNSSFIQNDMQIKQLQNQITDLGLSKSDNSVDKNLTLHEDIQRLRSEILDWKHHHLVIAPISGKASFSKIWSIHQSISFGDEIMAIIPLGTVDKDTNIVGRAILPGKNLGKIQPGNKAIIYLDAFPEQQYGSIEGSVIDIAVIPYGSVNPVKKGAQAPLAIAKEGYQIEIDLPNALQTTYGITVPFHQEMQGKVRVIAEDRRILGRIFDKLYDIIKNK